MRHALRTLVRTPGYTAVTAIVLGAGIGLNTSLFSTAEVLLFRNVLVPDLEGAVAVSSCLRGANDPWDSVAPADFLE
jgi:hypothetical protein